MVNICARSPIYDMERGNAIVMYVCIIQNVMKQLDAL